MCVSNYVYLYIYTCIYGFSRTSGGHYCRNCGQKQTVNQKQISENKKLKINQQNQVRKA